MPKPTKIEVPEGAAAVVFYVDGTVTVALPKMKPEDEVPEDSLTMLAGLCGALATDEWREVRQELIERMKETN